jgi:hypothetical protein
MAKPPASPTGPASPAARANRPRAVGEMIGAVGGVAFRRFGFAQTQLFGRWRDIVGPVYARWTVPEGLRFPHGKKLGGTLAIVVDGPFATQLQHVAPQIIERCNRVFGYAAVARITLRQGEVPQIAEATARIAAPSQPPSPELRAIRDGALREALEALAAQVGATHGPPVVK